MSTYTFHEMFQQVVNLTMSSLTITMKENPYMYQQQSQHIKE
jgi:hypothetical protein